ncbi:kinase-like protein [Annulohypoxylon bovei var. microspora]|nr:kinase-like protein [Annulohypoxylon bovei var. microspora]
MASSSYVEILRDLHVQIHEKLERREITELRFAKANTTCEVLHSANLSRLYHSLVPHGVSIEDQFGPGITAEILISRTSERRLYDFLATLIYARCSIESARGFIMNLLVCVPSDWPIYSDRGSRIDQLPADRPQLQQIFGTENDPDINSFIDTQPCFCPIVLLKGEDVQVPEGKKQRLPYVSTEKHLGEGSYGKVYSVQVAAGHLRDNRSSMVNIEPILIARKDFKKSDGFQKEYDNMKRILYTTRKCENILETLGSLQLGASTFSLFMPLAECDLKKWMNDNVPPTLDSEKADLLQYAAGLADGLEFLHSEIKDHNHNWMVCYHMDLKPANVLVFRNDRAPDKLIWKISDFGMSCVKMSRPNANYDDRDISNAFQRREEAVMSGTVNRRLDGTYLAPESSVSLRKMNEKSDVWSLGCVISVLLTYMEEGQNGIDKYSEDRASRSSRHGAENVDLFFIRNTHFAKNKLHPAVRDCHRRLVKKAKQRNSTEGDIVENLSRHLEEKILQLDLNRRESAKSIQGKLVKASDAYRKLSMGDPDIEEPKTLGTVLDRLQNLISRRKKIDKTQIRIWRLADARAFIGSSISPNGIDIAYWTNEWIRLYNAPSFLPHNDIAEYRLRGPSAWRSVKLTEKYLLASTTGPQPHLYLFYLDSNNLPGPNFDMRYEITLPTSNRNGVYQIAISPGGKVIACVASRDESRSWVYYMNIQGLLHGGIQMENPDTSSSSSDELQHMVIRNPPWKQFSVNALERSVTHLFFPSDDTLCAVAQPDISLQHSVQVSYLSLLTQTVVILPIGNPLNSMPQVFDSGNSGGLFTTITTTDNEQILAIVLYENQLLIRNFASGEEHHSINSQTTLQNYFISELLMDKRHSRLFALGKKSGKHMMLLLELVRSRSGHRVKPREIKELPNLHYGDRYVARLFNNEDAPSIQNSGELSIMDGSGIIVISAYTNNRTVIYWISLPKPE